MGVQRQDCGRLGKLANCQAGVFAGLGRGERTALVDFRLFLPQEWAEDGARCQRVKIPEAERLHRPKPQLALALAKAARARGLGHQWVGGDEGYGNNREPTDALDDLGETDLMDVASNLAVWANDPRPAPPPPSPHGRPAKRPKPQSTDARTPSVSALTAAHFAKEHRQTTLREPTTGPLRAAIWVRPVWLWNERAESAARARLLVVRREADGRFKYSLTNAPAGTPWERLGWRQAQRFFIERAFQDARSELGMAQYEMRGWRGWHHHITLCCMALIFTLKERIAARDHPPLLSVRDIVELLARYLSCKTRDPDQILATRQARHTARAASLRAASRRRVALTK